MLREKKSLSSDLNFEYCLRRTLPSNLVRTCVGGYFNILTNL